MQEKVKTRLRESRLLAPGGWASSRNLAFAFSCMSVDVLSIVSTVEVHIVIQYINLGFSKCCLLSIKI